MCSECMTRVANRPALLAAVGKMRADLAQFTTEIVAGGDEYDRGYRNGMRQQIRTIERMMEDGPCSSKTKG